MKEFLQQGVKTFLLSNAFFVLNFLGNLVLIRLLTPENFGTVALALALVGIVEIGTTFSLVIIYQQRRTSPSLISAIMQLSAVIVVFKIVVGLIMFLILKDQYSNQVWLLFSMIFVTKLIVPFSGMLVAILDKEMKFVQTTLIGNISNVAATILAIIAVVAGADVYGLVLRNVLPVLFILISAGYFNRQLSVSWRRIDRRQLKVVALASLQMYGVRASELGYERIPMLMVDALFGTEVLGYLNQSLYLANSVNRISGAVNQQIAVVFFSKYRKDRAAFKKGWLIMVMFSVALALPVMMLFYLFPQQIVGYLWGEKWIEAVPMLRNISFVVLLLPFFTILKSQLYGERKHGRIAWAYIAGIVVLFAGLQFAEYAAASSLVATAVVASYVVMVLISLPRKNR